MLFRSIKEDASLINIYNTVLSILTKYKLAIYVICEVLHCNLTLPSVLSNMSEAALSNSNTDKPARNTITQKIVHLVAQESFDHSRGVYSEYKKKNKFAIEESLEEVKDIYRGKSSGTFDKDKTVLVDIFVKHLPDDLKGSWARRESVYGIKGLRGPELDLQKKCTDRKSVV